MSKRTKYLKILATEWSDLSVKKHDPMSEYFFSLLAVR